MHAGHVACAIALGALLVACGDGGSAAPGGTAEIAVVNRTSGDPLETDGYVVRLDGEEHSLLVDDSIVLTGLEPRDYRLELAGIVAGCLVSGLNPRVVHLEAAERSQALFLVACSVPGTGRVFVQTFTYGEADGDYLIEGDGDLAHAIGAKDTVTLLALPGGPATLRLTRLGHCSVDRNPRTIVVSVGETVGTLFKVHCDLPAPSEPQLRVQRADPLPHPPAPE